MPAAKLGAGLMSRVPQYTSAQFAARLEVVKRRGLGGPLHIWVDDGADVWLPLLRDWLDDPELIAGGYCQDGRNYLPPDDIIPQGGYEIVTANAYTKAGPGPLRPGIDEAVRKTFTSMAERL